ncbi:hypothetical protein AMTRI_Chr08g208150 [Amborella trichopoda]|uniref:LOB domain-containing protein n=1 Tax=Amborella trichopoda TaxID=13333 RepID=W1PP67_AMBTC|nr:LOB domain-containing protein 15 [Amborella trichopoda]ERN08980.1 hypothetical protein AMTR_s00153p00034160 [Amborella trichopoda]|eukprot:XP_020524679.1 LOB domain-containing protein 15 [Amborella trichopoda]
MDWISSPSPSSSCSSLTTSSNQHHACASCRYQRRKCTPECVMAPHFPPNKEGDRQFAHVHKLFGVSSVLKILKECPDEKKGEAMRTIIYEADLRARDPILGAYGVVLGLYDKIAQAKAHLDSLNSILMQIRLHEQQAKHHHCGSLYGQHEIERRCCGSTQPVGLERRPYESCCGFTQPIDLRLNQHVDPLLNQPIDPQLPATTYAPGSLWSSSEYSQWYHQHSRVFPDAAPLMSVEAQEKKPAVAARVDEMEDKLQAPLVPSRGELSMEVRSLERADDMQRFE